MTPPRLHVLTAAKSPMAVILRRGPANHVASIGWNRNTNDFEVGQWLAGRIHEFRCDLSPDGRHMVYFACRGGGDCWTAVSRVPYLRAILLEKQNHSWGGGGAFTAQGRLWLNNGPPVDADSMVNSHEFEIATGRKAYPPSTDGFFGGNTSAALLIARGWHHEGGDGLDARLTRPLIGGGLLEQRFRLHVANRALISAHYSVQLGGPWIDKPDWHWADVWGDDLQYAANGGLWSVAIADATTQPGTLIKDFSDMKFAPLSAPYEGVPR